MAQPYNENDDQAIPLPGWLKWLNRLVVIGMVVMIGGILVIAYVFITRFGTAPALPASFDIGSATPLSISQSGEVFYIIAEDKGTRVAIMTDATGTEMSRAVFE